MKDLDRVGSSENFNFRGVPSFLQVCEKRFQANFMESLHSDGSAIYLLIIWVEKIIPLAMKSKQKPYPSIVFLSILSTKYQIFNCAYHRSFSFYLTLNPT